jgi:thiamine-monophosphate kinase
MSRALDAVGENRLLALWGAHQRRHPEQVNALHEADAELVPLPGTDRLLAVTTDTVSEEIALGFYPDAGTIGWVAAAASLSDLAAVAAEPVGLVVAVTLPRGAPRAFAEGLAVGLDAAARAAGTYVLGGDTNFGAAASVTTTAIGTVAKGRALTRVGCAPGEVVYASGRLGAGALPVLRAMGLAVDPGHGPSAVGEGRGRSAAADSAAVAFRPRPRLRVARLLPGWATACMDTSDGLVATLDQLARLNGVGFDVTAPLAEVLEPAVREALERAGLDPLLALAQPHGEFELVFTVPAALSAAFEAHARLGGLEPVRLGVTTEPGPAAQAPTLRFSGDGAPRTLDGARIRNLVEAEAADLRRCAAALAAHLATASPIPPPRAPAGAGPR